MNVIIALLKDSVQSLSRVWLFVIPWIAAHQISLTFTISWSFLTLMSIELVMPSNHLILCCPLLLLLQFFPAWESFPMSWLFVSRGQSIGASASALVLPMNIQGRFHLRLIGLISLSKGLSRVFSITTTESISSSVFSLLYDPTLIHTWLLEKP